MIQIKIIYVQLKIKIKSGTKAFSLQWTFFYPIQFPFLIYPLND